MGNKPTGNLTTLQETIRSNLHPELLKSEFIDVIKFLHQNNIDFVPEDCIIHDYKDKYGIIRSLGNGYSSEVFEAVSKESGQKVALKVLPLSVEKNIFLFKNEVTTLASLQHENIVKYVS